MKLSRTLLSIVVFIFASVLAFAATRVFVSGSGMDTGACPITAPCRSFAYAITQVASSGEIIALDTAGYGTVTIGQPVSIIAAPGATAFVAASAGDAISINYVGSQPVILRGLALTGTGASDGISFVSGSAVNVENCIVSGFTSNGILFFRSADTSSPDMRIINTMVRDNNIGFFILNLGPGSPAGGPPPNLSYATIVNSQFTGNADFGLVAGDNSRVTAVDTIFVGNTGAGVNASASADFSYGDLTLDHCTISHNGTGVDGGDTVNTQNLHGVVRLANCVITGNGSGIMTALDGQTLSRTSNSILTNTIAGNTFDGAPQGTYTAR